MRVRDAIGRFRRREVGGLVGDSFWVGIGQGATALAYLAQIALVTHALGLSSYGKLALAMSVVAVVGLFFNLKVGTVTTVFGAKRMRKDLASSRGVFQFGYLVTAVAGLVSFATVAVVALAVGDRLVGDQGALLIFLYGLSLLTAAFQDPGTAMLRLLGRFRLIAIYSVVIAALRLAFVAVAVTVFESLVAVVLALVVVDGLLSLAEMGAASVVFRRESSGIGWMTPGLREVREERRSMLRMMWHTNVATYGSLAGAQLPAVLIGALTNVTEVGVYKVGIAVASAMTTLLSPVYGSVLPRLSHLWHAGRGRDMRQLIRDASMISFPLMLVVGLLFAFPLRTPLLSLLGSQEAIAAGAGTVMVLGVAARGLGTAMFWNLPVLWATGRSRVAAWLVMGAVLVQVGLLVALVPSGGAIGAAVAVFVSVVSLNLASTTVALRAMRIGPPPPAKEQGDLTAEPTPDPQIV
jgi:O-antigen/teichoic acid export membrane protein